MILRNYFFTEDGILPIIVTPTNDGDITIVGEKDFLYLEHGMELNLIPVEITGPIFNSEDCIPLKIEIRTIDEPYKHHRGFWCVYR